MEKKKILLSLDFWTLVYERGPAELTCNVPHVTPIIWASLWTEGLLTADGVVNVCFVQVVYNLVDRWACILSLLSSDTAAISGNISHGFSHWFSSAQITAFFTCHLEQKEREREKHERKDLI